MTKTAIKNTIPIATFTEFRLGRSALLCSTTPILFARAWLVKKILPALNWLGALQIFFATINRALGMFPTPGSGQMCAMLRYIYPS